MTVEFTCPLTGCLCESSSLWERLHGRVVKFQHFVSWLVLVSFLIFNCSPWDTNFAGIIVRHFSPFSWSCLWTLPVAELPEGISPRVWWHLSPERNCWDPLTGNPMQGWGEITVHFLWQLPSGYGAIFWDVGRWRTWNSPRPLPCSPCSCWNVIL